MEGKTQETNNISEIMDGFKINWMKLRDGDNTSKVFWEKTDWDMSILDRTEHFDKAILGCSCISRQVDFSSKEIIRKFKIVQKVLLMGNQIEEWNFNFGFVMPNSTNTWDQVIVAADKEDMIPPEVLSGNMVIETIFYSGQSELHRSKMTVIYE